MVKKKIQLKPGFIKNEKGKTVSVYLEISEFNALLNELKKFDKIKQAVKKSKK